MADKRRTGRPPLDAHAPSVNVHFRLSSKDYDASYQEAQRARLTLSAWLRKTVRRAMHSVADTRR